MNTEKNFGFTLIIILCLIILSCKNENLILSSNSLNKANGIFKFKEKPFTGTVLDTTNSGRVLLTFNCIEGKINGKYLKYHKSNGNLNLSDSYVNGKKNGKHIKISKDNDTITYGTFSNSKKTGIWKEFYSKGILKNKGSYENGLQTGEWKYYFYNGKIKAEGSFRLGNKTKFGETGIPLSGRIGEWIFYSKGNGKIQQKCEFEKGVRNGNITVYHSNGKIKNKGKYKEGKVDGKVEFYNEYGKHLRDEMYKDGIKISAE